MSKKFKCTVCGYIHEGDEAPAICPKCKQPKEKFVEIVDEPKSLKGTKTEKNLEEAFAGESMARNKYTYFASKAKKEGYVQIAALFEETAVNEREHAKLWFKYLHGGEIASTAENLLAAAEGENFEWTDMYERMAPPCHLRADAPHHAETRRKRKREQDEKRAGSVSAQGNQEGAEL